MLVLIDVDQVQAAMNGWLRDWLPDSFAPVAAGDGPDRVSDPSGRPLIEAGASDGAHDRDRPHILLPVRTRFGTWHLASWDVMHRETVYATPALVGGAALAGLLLVMGCVAFGHQRRAAKLAQTRVAFVNQVSHALRSPMTNIQLNIDLAEESLRGNEGARRCLRLIRDEANRLGRLIENVLAYAERERGRQCLAMTPVVLDEVVDEVLAQFAGLLERRGITVDRQRNAGSPIWLDRDALFQVVGNLVSNVEKYAADGKKLGIQTWLDGQRLSLRVVDHGPGIGLRDRERIFDSFVRLDDRVNEGSSGTGLGLTIARGLARDMGGELAVVEEACPGAVFELNLPAPGAGDPRLS